MSNLSALQATIRHSEGTDRAPDPYRVVYGFTHTIVNMSDHPAVTGEWPGVQTPFGHTSAAGAYQIEKATWISLRDHLKLPDFSAASQDAAATELIREKGALGLIESGQVAAAISACHEVWASLPGSTSGQPQRTLASLMVAYQAAGGTLV